MRQDDPGSAVQFSSAGAAPTRIRWIVLAIVAFASASAYLTRYCISAANTTIQADLDFDDRQMGRLMGAFGLGYLLCQVPGGWLGNRFGTRFAFAFISVCWSLSNVYSGVASLFSLQWASRFSLGIFQAGLVPISAKIIRDWIPVALRGTSSACIGASMSVGGAFTLWFTGWLLAKAYDWRFIFYCYSAVGAVWSVGFYWYFRTSPREHPDVNQAELALLASAPDSGAVPVGSGRLLLRMVVSPGMWGLCVQSFCRAAGYAFFVTWFFAFLEYVYGIDKAEAGLLNSLPLLAVVLGSLTGGLLVDWLHARTGSKWLSRTGTAIAVLTVCGLFTMASAWTETATQLAVVIAVGAFFSGMGSPATWAATIDLGGAHTAVVVGVMNMAGCLAGVILPIVLGEWFDQLRVQGGDWSQVIYLHAAFYFVAALSWLPVNPARPLEPSRSLQTT